MAEIIEKVNAKSNIETNLQLEMEVTEGDFQGRYKSIIFDFDSENMIANIGIPIYRSAYMVLPKGQEVKVRVFSKMAVFLFKSTIIGLGKENNLRFMRISIPDIVFKVQRRQFVRIPILIEGFFYITDEYNKIENPQKYKFKTKDFSAGGISIITKKTLENNLDILVTLPLEEKFELKDFPSQIIRVIGTTPYDEFIYGVRFLNVEPQLEKEFVKYVFRKEIEGQKRKNL